MCIRDRYKPAYEATKPLLDQKGSPQRMGIFETKKDSLNFIYDVILGIRSHKNQRSKLRSIAKILPSNNWRKNYIKLIHKTRIKSEIKR